MSAPMIWLLLLLGTYVLAVYIALASLFLTGSDRRLALFAPVGLLLLNLPQIGFNHGLFWGGVATFTSTSISVWIALTYVPKLRAWADHFELRLPFLLEALTMRVEDAALWLRVMIEDTRAGQWLLQNRKPD